MDLDAHPRVVLLHLAKQDFGTSGWSNLWQSRPTALWYLPEPVILSSSRSLDLQTNDFGFIVSWATNASVVVEACSNLASRGWYPLKTNTPSDGWFYFSDRQWTNYPNRFYRVRSP
jgi:hypothetical protein